MEKPSFKLGGFTPATAQDRFAQKQLSLINGAGLAYGRTHEVTGESSDSFAFIMARKTDGPITWIGRGKDIYSLCPSALSRYFEPSRLITVECRTRLEILWAAEQALRSKGTECVIAQIDLGPDLKESRRLQLAAETGQALGLVMIERRAQSSAAQTRWHCKPDTSSKVSNHSQWIWELTKNKSGVTGAWHVEWQGDGYGTHHVHLATTTAA